MEKIEIERKYVIQKPNADFYKTADDYGVSEIEQIYLEAPKGETLRIRMRKYPTDTVYIKTHKIRIDEISCIERECELASSEYEALAKNILHGTRPILKKRHTFKYLGQLFEIDEYPEWQRCCIMEAELPSRDCNVQPPSFIRIIKDVTGDRAYSNASMSRAFPEELI